MKKTGTKTPINIKRRKAINRLIFDIIVFLVLITCGTILLNKSLNFENEKIIKYNEKSDLDYRVYLEENDFYEEPYLGKDMLYVASLIKKIELDFDYNFSTEDNETLDFEYKIVGKLSISNPTGTKAYFEKTYVLLSDKTAKMTNTSNQNIKETISVDYPYYNSLANGFKNLYKVDSDSKLTVYMIINKKNASGSDFELDNSSIMNVEIPLSEKSVDISLDYKKINETSNIIKKQQLTIKDFLPLIASVILVGLSIIMMIKAIRNINVLRIKKTKYDKYVSKILKEYDRLIAESSTLLTFDDKEIVDISKFPELLDIHDNLQLPIMYYEVKEHEECYFYIAHEKVVYLLKIDANYMDDIN